MFKAFLRKIIKPPVLVQRDGMPPYAKFNAQQVWLYPSECVAQFNEAISHCSEASQHQFRLTMALRFGPAFAA